MDLRQCPYCEACGLVTTMKLTPAGFEVSGRCTVCGYACDSDYATAEIADDLPFEFSQSMEACVVD